MTILDLWVLTNKLRPNKLIRFWKLATKRVSKLLHMPKVCFSLNVELVGRVARFENPKPTTTEKLHKRLDVSTKCFDRGNGRPMFLLFISLFMGNKLQWCTFLICSILDICNTWPLCMEPGNLLLEDTVFVWVFFLSFFFQWFTPVAWDKHWTPKKLHISTIFLYKQNKYAMSHQSIYSSSCRQHAVYRTAHLCWNLQ